MSLPHEVANRDNSNKDARAKEIGDEYVHHYSNNIIRRQIKKISN